MKPYEVIAATRGSALSPPQRHVLTHIAMRAGIDGQCWASVATLADDTGHSPRTVQRALAALVDLGVLRAAAVPGRSTTYTVCADRIPRQSDGGTPDSLSPHPSHPDTPVTESPPTLCHPTPDSLTPPPPSESHPTPVRESPDPFLDPIQRSDPGKRESALAPGAGPPGEGRTPPGLAVAAREALSAIWEREVVDLGPVRLDAERVVELWEARGRPPPDVLAAEVGLVARWARESEAAEGDIRGLNPDGRRWRADKSRCAEVLLDPRRFSDRLHAAQRHAEWADPPTRSARRRRGSRPDPADTSGGDIFDRLMDRLRGEGNGDEAGNHRVLEDAPGGRVEAALVDGRRG